MQQPPRFTPLVECALLLVALPLLRVLGLSSAATASEVIARLRVSRSQAYTLKTELVDTLLALPRPRGRPPQEPHQTPDDTVLTTVCTVRDHLMRNPGSMVVGKRRNDYTDGFRRFVVELIGPDGPGAELNLEQAAYATGVPQNTLKDWLATPPIPVQDEPSISTLSWSTPSSLVPAGAIEKLMTLWQRWKGSFTAFVDHLPQHRLHLSLHTVRQILQLAGVRIPQSRSRKSNDPEALRGAFETFFPGAQFVADGKTIDVTLGERTFRFCWELIVDTASGALVGFAVRDAEDATGLLDALEKAHQTTDDPPEALLRDNLPANHTPQVEEALQDDDIISMPSTAFRPENKAHVEGEFGLFSQSMPDIDLPADSGRELARALLSYLLFAYAAGRNQVPRGKLGGRSAARTYREDVPSEEQRQAARKRLLEIRNRILDARRAERARLDPVCRQILEQAFATLDLDDPEGTFIPAIARLGLDAALEAIAVYKAKRDANTLPQNVDARYLLGIARNIAHRNEDEAVYAELVRLREQAGDLLRQPLRDLDARLQATLHPEDYLQACFDRALYEPFLVDRHFWRCAACDAFNAMPADIRHRWGTWLARMIATQYDLDRRERDLFIAGLAKATESGVNP